MERSSLCHETPDIRITRKVYDESLFTPVHRHSVDYSDNKHLHSVYTKLASCSCSWVRCLRFIIRLAPIIRWLPKYVVKEDLLADLTGGVTVGIMHVPLGNIAYI